MTWTNWGFDGTINEAQWSQMAGLLGNGYVAADASSCVTTAVPGARSVSVSAGTLYGDGIVSVNSAAKTVAMTTPVNGQWYVIALRRTWSSNTVELVAVAGATTTTTTPTAPPSTLPTLNADPGVITDQPIAWAWCNSANTTVVIYDMRQFPVRRMPLTVANNVVRDGIFQTPTQGQQVWRNDLGAVETYYGAYNAISNPGGRDTAGWYVDDRQTGLRPISPSSVVIATGSGSANALGVISFTGATAISLNGIFTSQYKNYKMILDTSAVSTSLDVLFRFRKSGTDRTNSYYSSGLTTAINGASAVHNSNNDNRIFLLQIGASQPTRGRVVADITAPNTTLQARINYNSGYDNGSNIWNLDAGGYNVGDSGFDGFTILCSAGNFAGTIQVFGYND
jgi:hypothetical protein